MRRRWLCLGVVAGCGRLGFSDRATGDARADAPADLGTTDAPICHTGTWGTPQPIASTVTVSEEVNPSVSPDELTLYFSSNQGGGTRKLWSATRASRSDPFGTPAPLVGTGLASTADDLEPEISSDGLTLYFTSRRSGSDAIYVATRPSLTSQFAVQQQLVVTGDASTAQQGPTVSPDELTLYYTPGLVNMAVATRATRTDPFVFVRLLAEVNAPQTDTEASISADGLELFWESFRTGPVMIYTASRASTGDPFSAPIGLAALAAGNPGAGSPAISADGRTLYYFITDGTQDDLYTVTRNCP